jgi:hypothetical protein
MQLGQICLVTPSWQIVNRMGCRVGEGDRPGNGRNCVADGTGQVCAWSARWDVRWEMI